MGMYWCVMAFLPPDVSQPVCFMALIFHHHPAPMRAVKIIAGQLRGACLLSNKDGCSS